MTWVEWAWWGTLAAGLVIAGVVAFLLEWLRRTVLEVERGVDAVWTMGKRVAQNTATTHTLAATRARGLDLLHELQLHADIDAEGSQR